MKASVNIGNETDKVPVAIEAIGAAIAQIFESARKHSMDQSTVMEALRTLSKTAEVSGITITSSTFSGDKIVNMDNDPLESKR